MVAASTTSRLIAFGIFASYFLIIRQLFDFVLDSIRLVAERSNQIVQERSQKPVRARSASGQLRTRTGSSGQYGYVFLILSFGALVHTWTCEFARGPFSFSLYAADSMIKRWTDYDLLTFSDMFKYLFVSGQMISTELPIPKRSISYSGKLRCAHSSKPTCPLGRHIHPGD